MIFRDERAIQFINKVDLYIVTKFGNLTFLDLKKHKQTGEHVDIAIIDQFTIY